MCLWAKADLSRYIYILIIMSPFLSQCFKHWAVPLRIAWQKLQQGIGCAIYEQRSKQPSCPPPTANDCLRAWVTSGALELGAGESSFHRQTLLGRKSEGASRSARERAARRRLRPALATLASPLPGEVQDPRAQPVGGAGPRGAGPRGGGGSAGYIKPAPA